ncbi:hypothetical protein [Streptomyces sp. HUAS TT7]
MDPCTELLHILAADPENVISRKELMTAAILASPEIVRAAAAALERAIA